MIAFGCSITMPEVYDACAKAGIEFVAETDSAILAHAAAGSVARSCNLMLDRAKVYEDLEALVLIHQDAEIVDRNFCAKLRKTLEVSSVGVIGCVGAVGTRDIAWWDGRLSWTSARYRYGELGGGELLWNRSDDEPTRRPGEVDTVYGVLIALAPWVVHSLRFDESLGQLHGYDFDICAQTRAAGGKVATADLDVVHHHSLDLITETEPWVATHMRVAEKWDAESSNQPDTEIDWKSRARRAEAAAAAARLLAASKLLQAYAAAEYNERRLAQIAATRSWRVTEPLRRVNAARKRMTKPGPVRRASLLRNERANLPPRG